jgi:hypothetical protein
MLSSLGDWSTGSSQWTVTQLHHQTHRLFIRRPTRSLLCFSAWRVMARGAIVIVAVAMMAHSQARVAYSTTGPTVELEGLVCLGLVVS